MRIAGIIAEYNPFHSGHALHIEETRRQAGASHIAVAMSGNYVQRGDLAVFSKWARARAALLCGADLVIELPTPFAMSSAKYFAQSGVALLDALSCDIISFGSESGSMDALRQAAQAVLAAEESPLIKDELGSGKSYASARYNSLKSMYGEQTAAILEKPNNTLGIEYINAALKMNKGIDFFTVARAGAAYHSKTRDSIHCSATYLRTLISDRDFSGTAGYIPEAAYKIFSEELAQGFAPCLAENIDRALLAILRRVDAETLRRVPDCGEGLENRILSKLPKAEGFNELCMSVKTKRYARTRINRVILGAALNMTRELTDGGPCCVKVLALNDRGREILKKSRLPVVSKPADTEKSGATGRLVEFESSATDLFALSSPVIRQAGLEFLQSPFYLGD